MKAKAVQSSFRDRTQEFLSVSERLRKSITSGTSQNGPSSSSSRAEEKRSVVAHQSEFNRRASKIGFGIHQTSQKLSKLAKLAKRTSVFDDPTMEIQELTAVIKQDITALNSAVVDLQLFCNSKNEGGVSSDTSSHSTTVVDDLKNRLMSATKEFKDVLTMRTENLKVHENRRQLFSSTASKDSPNPFIRQRPLAAKSAAGASNNLPQWANGSASSSQLFPRKQVDAESQPFLQQQQQHQQQMVPLQDSYMQSRAEALQNVESTIHELGTIFNQLATLVSQQGEIPEGSKTVQQFLLEQGVAADKLTTTKSGDFVFASLPVHAAENMLRTEFIEFQHTTTRKTTIKTPMYSIPVSIADHLDFVSANCLFPTVRPMSIFTPKNISLAPGQTHIDGYVDPSVLFKVYGVANPVVSTTASTQSVYESLGQSYDADDLAQFQQQFNIPNNPIAKVIGPNQPGSCSADPNNCVEALLDVEYIMALAQNAPTTFWSMSDTTNFLDWIVAVGQDSQAPLVHSVSYGDIEPQDDFSVDSRFDQEVQELGLRGLTVVVASGDDGVANFIARSNSSACGFNPSFPATSPHVTAVGATQGPEQSQPEIACTSSTNGLITTGGGFSVNFAQPSYQTKAVNNYKTRASLPPSNMFNISNRGYPDVAMLGHNYITIIGGQTSAGSGTSASAPVFAAVITWANGVRLAKGKSPLGFLNQALYYLADTQPSVFRDVTSGENNCCAGDPSSAVCCQYGFYAAAGWDPLTGLGSVDFASFTTALANL